MVEFRKVLADYAEPITASATGALIDDACYLHSFYITNVNAATPGAIILLRDGATVNGRIIATSAVDFNAAGDSPIKTWDPPLRANGLYIDGASSGAGTWYVNLTITRFHNDRKRYEDRAQSDPMRGFAGKGLNKPVATGTRGGAPGLGGSEGQRREFGGTPIGGNT